MSRKLLRAITSEIFKQSRCRCPHSKHVSFFNHARYFSSQVSPQNVDRKPDVSSLFLNDEVQQILKKMTGFNLDKIFKFRPTSEYEAPNYELMTDQQVSAALEEYTQKGEERLQMPPVLPAWDDSYEVLSDGTDIAGFDDTPYVFTDITYGVKAKSRVVVVREPNGLLRTATAWEHDSVMQTYFPREGRMYQMPQMFEAQALEHVLAGHGYEYILDRACAQFEPDDPEYARVTQRTYENIDSTGSYEHLWSTRHYGVMVYYLTTHKQIDGLLKDLLTRDLLSDAGALVKLYHTLHPECESAKECLDAQITNTHRIQSYISKDSKDSGPLELAFQVYNEQQAAS